MKNIKRILSLLIIIFVILSALALNKAFAVVIEELALTAIGCSNEIADKTKETIQVDLQESSKHSTVNKNEATLEFKNGEPLTEEDLIKEYPLFCRNKEIKILEKADTSFWTTDAVKIEVAYDYNNGSPTATPSPKTYDLLWDTLESTYYYATTKSYYEKDGPEQMAKPKEAYILAEMINNNSNLDNRARTLRVDERTLLTDDVLGFIEGCIDLLDWIDVFDIITAFDETRLERCGIIEINNKGEFADLYIDNTLKPILNYL